VTETRDRKVRIDAVFNRALEIRDDDRGVFLTAECNGDRALRDAVEDLLRYAAHPGLESPPWDEALWRSVADGGLNQPEAAIGDLIGPYRLLEELGRGGMATVYLAARDDRSYIQQVALKLFSHELGTPGLVGRFQAERQVLAGLEHPNIARLLDGGETEDGRPYLVMEHVSGVPIDEYCDKRQLDIEARLELVCTVAHAVQHAHRNLIVHRDLKPGNILVSAHGEVKLLDFGIAKQLDPPQDLQHPPTATRHRLMTPEYASPEQARGEVVTTASDVYQLGLLLFELMVGHRAHRPADSSAAALDRAICETPSISPSTAVLASREKDEGSDVLERARSRGTKPDRLARRLRGDLDRITQMALRKEPDRRYGTVDDLAADLERHLMGFPVVARSDSLGYRAGRVISRHWVVASLATLLVVMLAVYAVTASVQSRKLRTAVAQAEAARDFLFEILRGGDRFPVARSEERLRLLVERAASRLESRIDEESPQQDHLRALVTDLRLALADGAGDTTTRELLDIGTARLLADHEMPDSMRADLLIMMAELYRGVGVFEPAVPLLREAVSLHRELFSEDDPRLADAVRGFARTLHFAGRYGEALPLYREALSIRRINYGEVHREVAESTKNLGGVLHGMGEFEQAQPLLERAVALRERLHERDSEDLAYALRDLGDLLTDRGDYVAAEGLYRRALAIERRIYPDASEFTALTLDSFGRLELLAGRPEAAEPLLLEAWEIRRLKYEDHPVLGISRLHLGQLALERGNLEEAEPMLRLAAAHMTRTLGEHSSITLEARLELARLIAARGDRELALGELGRIITIMSDQGLSGHQLVADALVATARIGTDTLTDEQRETALSRAFEIRRAQLFPGTAKMVELK